MAKPVKSLNNKPKRDAKSGRFLQGNHSGGRPIGSRPKLAAQFLDDLHADYSKHGKSTIKVWRTKHPDKYMTAIVGLLPKEASLDISVTGLFADVRDFATAFRMARDYIGAEPLLIEGDSSAG
jgi:hypothetical protein